MHASWGESYLLQTGPISSWSNSRMVEFDVGGDGGGENGSESVIVLPNKQRQLRTLHVQRDMLPCVLR